MVATARLSARMPAIARRFQPQNYGWKNAALTGSITRGRFCLFLEPEKTQDCFDCGSATKQAQIDLKSEGIKTDAILLTVPTNLKKGYTHFALRARGNKGYHVFGFTPFDSMLGLKMPTFLQDDSYDQFRRALGVKVFLDHTNSETSKLPLSGYLKRFYPFSYRTSDGSHVLTELGIYSDETHIEATIRASQLYYDAGKTEISFLSMLSFTLSFPGFFGIRHPLGSLLEERTSGRNEWRVCRNFGRDDDETPPILLESINDDWQAFAAFIAKLNPFLVGGKI